MMRLIKKENVSVIQVEADEVQAGPSGLSNAVARTRELRGNSLGVVDKGSDSSVKSILAMMEQDNAEAKLLENPVIQKMMQKFVRREFDNLQKESQGKFGEQTQQIINKTGQSIKFPSDTTIYAPALKLVPVPTNEPDLMIRDENNDKPNSKVRQEIGSELMKNINSFLEQVRIEATPEDRWQQHP